MVTSDKLNDNESMELKMLNTFHITYYYYFHCVTRDHNITTTQFFVIVKIKNSNEVPCAPIQQRLFIVQPIKFQFARYWNLVM